MKSIFKKIGIIFIDALLTGVALIVFALFHHVLPRDIKSENTIIESNDNINSCSCDGNSNTNDSDLYSKELIYTDEEYKSENISIKISHISEQFENKNVNYHVADIHIKNIESFQTAFAKDKFGKGYNEWLKDIAKRNNAILAINGDYYGLNSKGVVIRNGVLYRKETIKGDIGVLYRNGVLKTYSNSEFNADEVIANGAWQAWNFGPGLLDENGKVKDSYKSSVTPRNPRTAIGYVSPGHYIFVVVEGRTKESAGVTMSQLASIFEKYECKSAYNLDGGQSSTMIFNDKIINKFPDAEGERTLSDAIIIKEVTNE